MFEVETLIVETASMSGRYHENPISVLDQLLPALERGKVRVLGEAPSGSYERLAAQYPRLRLALETVDVQPMEEAETLDLARQWAIQEPAPPKPRATVTKDHGMAKDEGE